MSAPSTTLPHVRSAAAIGPVLLFFAVATINTATAGIYVHWGQRILAALAIVLPAIMAWRFWRRATVDETRHAIVNMTMLIYLVIVMIWLVVRMQYLRFPF